MYLNNTSRDLEMLDNHPLVKSHQLVKSVFLYFKTSFPSSAHVERLFSSVAQILSKKRNKLPVKCFEELFLLKVNNCYWESTDWTSQIDIDW